MDLTRVIQAAIRDEVPFHAGPELAAVYRKLRAVAQAELRRERRDHTLGPTDLTHECFVLLRQSAPPINDRHHFFRLVRRMFQNILVNHALRKRTVKRGGLCQRVALSRELVAVSEGALEQRDILLDLSDAMDELGRRHPELYAILRGRFHLDLTYEELSLELGCSPGTARNRCKAGLMFLFDILRE
jgi:RNA polymerase sigma factor (TIGR02999 family)